MPLDARVRRPLAAAVCGLLGLVVPYLMIALKSLRLDPETQGADGFPAYAAAGRWVADHLRPEWVGAGLLGLAVLLYLWARPRRRDVFWDIAPRA
ncbi:MAG: hypothetical protein K2X87_06120 [Gemmataceae bacterium]|nr:hypothetical protein [Gemmataceae bacterium]